MANPTDTVETIAGCNIHVLRAGQGAPLLFLHGAGGLEWLPFLNDLSERFQVIAPEHPGFGRSDTPDWLRNIGDLAFFYLDFLERLDLSDAHLIGHSLGGWLAAEIAIRNTTRLKSLTLISAAGLRVEGVETGDIFLWTPQELIRNLFVDQAYAEEMLKIPPSDAELATQMKNMATVAQLGWKPRLYDPQLSPWLHRIDLPTLLLWGDSDKIIPAAIGEAYLKSIAGARLKIFPQCGHLPIVERRAESVDAITRFLDEGAP
jgi:pimeloyl-ACP methyl ester carboxylesterase